MNEVKAIDFPKFNRPKYFPEWLREGETLKLAEYGDGHFEELDANIRAAADQYDIDNVSGECLDRIGKVLGEERNGNSDEVYRVYLKLRAALNTANGTVEDIIRFCKFFFGGEVVHIVPNYPAGIHILHDGYNDAVNFNRIVKNIIGAGIGYDTRELFYMTDEMPFEDAHKMVARRRDKEPFARSALRHNGRALYDGRTVLDTEWVDGLLHNGRERYDGSVSRRGIRRAKAEGRVGVPLLHNGGIADVLALEYSPKPFVDSWRAKLLRDGAVLYDGSEQHCGVFSRRFAADEFSVGVRYDYRHNGTCKRDGGITYKGGKLFEI